MAGENFWMMCEDRPDGAVDIIVPFDLLGRRTVRNWSPLHVAAALPGRRHLSSASIRDAAWKTVFELSRYAREGTLPLYPYHRVSEAYRIPASAIWLLYPSYPVRHPRSEGRGLIEFRDGTMIEAVADMTTFRRQVMADHPSLPRMGRPIAHPELFYAAQAFWRANRARVKPGVVLDHIRTHAGHTLERVPTSSAYRVIEKARMDARKIR